MSIRIGCSDVVNGLNKSNSGKDVFRNGLKLHPISFFEIPTWGGTIAESFYYVKYGSSVVDNVRHGKIQGQ